MDETLLHSWNETVRADSRATALIDAATGQRWTRQEVDVSATEWVHHFGAALAGQTVAFAAANGAEWMRVFLGLLKSDAAAVPLDPGEPIPAQRATASQIGAYAWWSAGELHPLRPPGRRPRNGRRLIKLTSGSTGAPRPLWFTDAQLIADGRQIITAMGLRPDDLNLGLIPWGHSYGLGNLVMPLLMQGTSILFGAAPLPHAIAKATIEFKPTVFPAVPALLQALADAAIARDELASLRTVISAGAPLAPAVAQAFIAKFGQRIHSFYGSSETGGITYDATGDSAALGRGLGTPLPGVRLTFGRGGRFSVASAAVYTIHNRRPGAHRMPDIGRLEVSGELILLGRAGRFLKIAGRRLNAAEVEHALRQIPGVRDAAVGPHPERADALAAVIATDISASIIRDALRERLASWKIPRKWIVLPNFPLTSRGKPDLRKVRELLARGTRAEGPESP
mgnify:CR=1 FL=1